ncbi:MAG: NAD-dependent epimerase/dehydratase family protein, partial [Pseudomonadota bacterium]
MKILILGANGFIGSNLSAAILAQTDWHIYAMDMAQDKLSDCLEHSRFHFFSGDMTVETEWVTERIKECDVVLPLVAIATPAVYVQEPLRVFELDFEANLAIIRQCVKYHKRIIFP